MKTIVSYIQNRLLSSGLKHAIECAQLGAIVEVSPGVESCAALCRGVKPDIFIAEVRDTFPLTPNDWFVRVDEIKQSEKSCKIIFVVDEEIYPKTAQEARAAFADKKIDLFFYSSSGLNYLADTVNSL